MWWCPFGKEHSTKCESCCSSSKYGRVIKTKSEWDIRLYIDVPCGTDAYKKIHNQRTATERINNRVLNDYGLHQHMIHRKEHYSFLTTIIGICIRLDAAINRTSQSHKETFSPRLRLQRSIYGRSYYHALFQISNFKFPSSLTIIL